MFRLDQLQVIEWQKLLPLMAHFVVLKCDYRYDLAQFEYLAFSKLFDEIPHHTAAPLYIILNTGTENGVPQFRAKRHP